MTVHEFEDLLRCPREHLDVSLWYLKEKGWIARRDSGRYTMTVEGFDHAETGGAWRPNPDVKLLPDAEAVAQ